jgi:hypothetical protein
MATTATLRRSTPIANATRPDKPVRKSKIAIFWEKNPNGIITVLDRRAVNR